MSIPGGGAEIFASRVRRKICDDKATAEQWLEVHRAAHRLGLKSNATMLYGHIETMEERVDHMLRDLSVILSSNTGKKDIEVLFDIDPRTNLPTEASIQRAIRGEFAHVDLSDR